MNTRLRIPLAIFIAAAVTFPLLMLLTSPQSITVEGQRWEQEVECACANLSTVSHGHNVSELEQRLAQYGEMLAIAPYTFYPLYIPDFRQFVQRLTRGEAVEKTPINDALATMEFPMAPLLGSLGRLNRLGLLILVKTAAKNVGDRTVYRSTWANPEYLKGIDMPVAYAFLVGIGQFKGNTPPELVAEALTYQDILFQDFVESYRNNTYKTIGGLKWAIQKGPQFEFLAIIDDDLYFSVEQAVRLLRFPDEFFERGSNSRDNHGQVSKFGAEISPGETFLAGYKAEEVKPYRDPRKPGWYVSWDEYPLETYAPYCAGMTTFFSAATAREIYEGSLYVKPFPVDDAFIGLVAMKLGITITGIWEAVDPSHDSKDLFVPHKDPDGVPLIARHIPGNSTLVASFWYRMHSQS